MTYEQLEQANQLKERITSLNDLIEWLSGFDLQFKPPTRMSSINLVNSSHRAENLNEGELYVVKTAFVKEKKRLEEEFEKFLND